MRKSAGWTLLPLLLVLACLFVWPVLRLLVLSFGEHGFTLANYARLLRVPIYRVAFVETFEIAVLVTLLSIVLSYPLAYLMAASRPRTRQVLMVLVLLPFWMSALVRTTAWLILLQHNGILNTTLVASGLVSQPIAFVYNLPGVLIGMTHVLMPFIVLPLAAAFRGIDSALIQAAEGLGAGSLALLRRLLLPLTAPAVLAGAAIVFMSAVGYYITPALMGGPAQTMIAQLIDFNIETQLDWGLAAALSVILLFVTLLVFGGFNAMFGLDRLLARAPTGGTGSSFATTEQRHSHRRLVAALLSTPVLLFLVAPVVIVFPMSLGSSPLLAFPPTHLTLTWYRELFTRPEWIAGLRNSLIVAAIAVPLASALGTAGAIGLLALRRRWARWVEMLVVMPMIIPPMILAIGLYYLFAPLGLLRGPWGLALGHVVLAVPFVVLTVRASLLGFDPVLAEAAVGLGAAWPVMFRRIMLPAILPGIAAGAMFAFITSFDDVVLALFLTNLRSRTLPKLMFEGVAQQIDPVITAAAALITLLTLLILGVSLALSRGEPATAA
jgi:putative spermidine/putrescine transport system permease protein